MQGLGIAVMSYNGNLDFGLNADWDALPDVDLFAEDLRGSLKDLLKAARTQAKRKTSAGKRDLSSAAKLEG